MSAPQETLSRREAIKLGLGFGIFSGGQLVFFNEVVGGAILDRNRPRTAELRTKQAPDPIRSLIIAYVGFAAMITGLVTVALIAETSEASKIAESDQQRTSLPSA